MRRVMRVECGRCSEPVVLHESDAIDLVDHAIELFDADVGLQDVDVPTLCDDCEHVKTKKDAEGLFQQEETHD